VQDHQILVCFFAASATASYEQLGWDISTQRALTSDQKIRYRSRVAAKRYENRACLSGFQAHNLAGCATGVGAVIEIQEGPEGQWIPVDSPCILKEIRIDAKKRQEAITIKLIWRLLKRRMLEYPNAPDATNLTTEATGDYPLQDKWLNDADNDPALNIDAAPSTG
jgi:hypothetical protein